MKHSIVLLTPYNGGNLGDAAIQDAIIGNLRHRLPDVLLSGISLDCERFLKQHGAAGFPLCATNLPFFGMSVPKTDSNPNQGARCASRHSVLVGQIKGTLRKLPGLLGFLKKTRDGLLLLPRETLHFIRGYRFLCKQDLLIVSGGGQLSEEWGGPWGHPFALFKWALLAWIARVPYVFVSVGVGKLKSPTSRLFLFVALRLASYRSYRNKGTRDFITGLTKMAVDDPLVPDLAFSLTATKTSPVAGIWPVLPGQNVVAISLIAFAKPGSWPHQDDVLYRRYLRQMSQVVAHLLERGYCLILVYSSIGDDDKVIPELLEQLDENSKKRLPGQIHVPEITNWLDLTAALLQADFVVASRLHSTILSFVSQRPAIAISFDSKVDRVMEDLGQTDYLLQIRDFTADDLIKALARLELRKQEVTKQIGSYRQQILPRHSDQYDALVRLAGLRHKLRN
jgi:polysaccharide pyruvyl transferase WcaK-like protein